MCLNRFQLKLFNQCFELEGIHLLFPAFLNVVIDKINTVPHKQVNESIKRIAKDNLRFRKTVFLPASY